MAIQQKTENKAELETANPNYVWQDYLEPTVNESLPPEFVRIDVPWTAETVPALFDRVLQSGMKLLLLLLNGFFIGVIVALIILG